MFEPYNMYNQYGMYNPYPNYNQQLQQRQNQPTYKPQTTVLQGRIVWMWLKPLIFLMMVV